MAAIPLGMVGGGIGALIGGVHRTAAQLDGHFRLVAGALSSDPGRAAASAASLGLDPARSYDSFAQMAEAEAARPDGIRAVAIVTPNHLHAAPAIEFLRRGIHVICDKPLAASLAQAEALKTEAERSSALFLFTHNYSAYPMIRQAQAMVAAGALGRLRLVQVEYFQDWLTRPVETTGSKQAEWRTDPARSGLGGALGDIGTHAFHLAGFVLGQQPGSVAADLSSFGQGRQLDDTAHVMLRYDSGMRGTLLVSQVAPGNENSLRLRIYGDEGGLDWSQEDPNRLWLAPYGQPKQLLSRGGPGTLPEALRLSRVPAGHPEGYLEGFAALYSEAARAIQAHEAGQPWPAGVQVPGLADGLAGMAFMDACLRSAASGSSWQRLA